MTWLGNVNHFLPLLFISTAVFAFSFIVGALITDRRYDGISFNVLRQLSGRACIVHKSCQRRVLCAS